MKNKRLNRRLHHDEVLENNTIEVELEHGRPITAKWNLKDRLTQVRNELIEAGYNSDHVDIAILQDPSGFKEHYLKILK